MSGSLNARGRRTVAAIEEAALAATRELDFSKVTVGEICDRAGVSERVFFNHFPTREDAFLGLEHPYIDEAWAGQYIAADDIPLLTGASRLVIVPSVTDEVRRQRQRLISAHPRLLARAHAILLPVRERCREIVSIVARRRYPGLAAQQIDQLARIIVAAAAELIGTPPDAGLDSVLDAVRQELR